MLTRRRAKLAAKLDKAEPEQPEAASIDLLSLETVFSYLPTDDLIRASQVCRQWRELCGSRRLWADRKFLYHENTLADGLRVVRTLRRAHGVAPFTKLVVRTGQGPLARFEDQGETLVVGTSSSFMLLMSLRHLVGPRVRRLHLLDFEGDLSACEALFVWETIASHKHLMEITIILCGFSNLLSSVFEWQEPGCIRRVVFSVLYGPTAPRTCIPIRSLMRVHRNQLELVQIEREDQQKLLELCPPHLITLSAVLLPSLVKVLQPMYCLSHLFLHGAKSPASSRKALKEVLCMSNIRWSLIQLDVLMESEDDVDDMDEEEALLGNLSGFDCLVWVRLTGLCGVLGDATRGPAVLRSLMQGLPDVKELNLGLEPCRLPLGALLPPPVAAGSAASPLRLPESLRLLTLGSEDGATEHCAHRDGRWLAALRRLMDAAPQLHVRVDVSDCDFLLEKRSVVASKTVVMPHSARDYCKDCPGFAAKKEGYRIIYIGDCFKNSA